MPSVHHDSLKGVGMPPPSLFTWMSGSMSFYSYGILDGVRSVGATRGDLVGDRDLRGLLMGQGQQLLSKLPG